MPSLFKRGANLETGKDWFGGILLPAHTALTSASFPGKRGVGVTPWTQCGCSVGSTGWGNEARGSIGEMWVLKEVGKMLFLTANRPFPFLERLFAGWWAEGGTAFKCI